VFLRCDLPISQQAIQAAHAAIELGKNGLSQTEHPSLVFLATKDKEALSSALAYASELGIKTFEFHEPYCEWGLTAFACEPITHRQRKMFKHFNLWRK
jgi:hypothetical protein